MKENYSMLTFRWSIWNEDEIRLAMLKRSIESFRKYMPDANFIITAFDPDQVIDYGIKVDEIFSNKGGLFDINVYDAYQFGFALFRKFAPNPKMTNDDEIFCDIDVFCINEPKSIYNFLQSSKDAMIQCRSEGNLDNRRGFGTWASKIHPKVPPCCSGFIGMKPNYDFTDKLVSTLYEAIESNNFFQEQGAVIKAMEDDIINDRVWMADEKTIRYYASGSEGRMYALDLDNITCEIVHCIASPLTDYKCFNRLVAANLI